MIEMYNQDHPKLARNALPIKDPDVISFIKQTDSQNFFSNALQDADLREKFLTEYFKWINKSTLNQLKGLQNFKNLSFVHGTSQTFDFFYTENNNRRFRCFKGDFIYHKLSWQQYYRFSYLDDEDIEKDDAVVISVPFSDNGYLHDDTDKVIQKCNKLGVPVLIDLAYYNLVRELDFSLEESSITCITFSLSKAFSLFDRLRVGIRCKIDFTDDPVDFFNEVDMFNKAGAALGLEIIKKFSPDYNQNKYHKKQEEICTKFGLEPSKCVNYGLGDNRYSKFNRGAKWNRVCLSNLLIE